MSIALQTIYKQRIIPAMKEKFGYKNVMQTPRVEKVVLNVGFGRNVKDKGYIEGVERTLARVTGQKPVLNKAKKSISNFKIRQGMEVGASVTLRGKSMYDFLYKLIHLTFPRVRDFRGLSRKSFDNNGNYTVGFKENLAFPEMGSDSNDLIHGIEVTVCTTARNKDEGMELLSGMGFPFKDEN